MTGTERSPGPALPVMERAGCAVVTIDLHRGHLDPAVATMPLPADVAARVTEANARFLQGARERSIPVVHALTSYRSVAEIATNPWWSAVAGSDATRANVLSHQLPGSPGLELMPAVYRPGTDLVVDTKKRYDAFAGTDLDATLRALGARTVLLTGVNTSSCVLATTTAGNARDYAMVVVSDCVDSMDPALHAPALAIVAGAFGWVADSAQVLDAL